MKVCRSSFRAGNSAYHRRPFKIDRFSAIVEPATCLSSISAAYHVRRIETDDIKILGAAKKIGVARLGIAPNRMPCRQAYNTLN